MPILYSLKGGGLIGCTVELLTLWFWISSLTATEALKMQA